MAEVMIIKIAESSGFCFGVEKAVSKAFEATEEKANKSIYSLGPIIHNNQVIDRLKDSGLDVIESIKDIDEGTVIIRSHGVGKSVYEEANIKQIDLIDTTCPFVKRIQNIVKDYHLKGYQIVIIGNPKHPEVKGINGWCQGQGIIIQDIEDIPEDQTFENICIVVQTTMPLKKFHELSGILEKMGKHVKKFDTTCFATKERQEAALDLAGQVDAMIVIGGFNSSNTQKLVNICKELLPDSTYHIETAEGLSGKDLSRFERVGVTAGASTPDWVIQDVIRYLNKFK